MKAISQEQITIVWLLVPWAQDILDTVNRWAWSQTQSATLIQTAISARGTGFLAGVEFQRHYDPAMHVSMPGAMQNIHAFGANWVFLSPSWTYTAVNPLGWLAPLYILAVPIVDTLYVIVLRLRAGRKVYYGSPDHFPLRVRRRLDGWTGGTVVVSYAVAVVFGALGLVVLYLDPVSTLVLTAVVGAVTVGLLTWLAMVPMEA